MNPDTLERLSIDRTLGELLPDVAELLDAHLAGHPDAADESRRVVEVLGLAGQAMRTGPRMALPARRRDADVLPFPREAPVPWRGHWRTGAIGAIAGCVGGLAIGMASTRGPAAVPARPADPIAVDATAPSTPGPSGFWSSHRLHAEPDARPMRPDARVVWKSPVRKPEIERSL